MVSVSPMEIHVITSGLMLVVCMILTQYFIVAVVPALQHQELDHQNLLATITTVNREILTKLGIRKCSTEVTDSGMGSSVKVPAAVVQRSPPWFSVQLPTQTSNRIEVRICADESTSNEDVLIELLEIFGAVRYYMIQLI